MPTPVQLAVAPLLAGLRALGGHVWNEQWPCNSAVCEHLLLPGLAWWACAASAIATRY